MGMGLSRLWVLLWAALLFPFLSSIPRVNLSLTTSVNSTLLFNSVTHGNCLRNCTCSVSVPPCNEARANLLCSCRTALRSALPPGGLRAKRLSVWVSEPWVLTELLNGSQVAELSLSLCAHTPHLSSAHYLTLFGLQRLRVQSSVKGALHPEQTLNISAGLGQAGRGEASSPEAAGAAVVHVAVLDLSILKGETPLKAYSVRGVPAPFFTRHFPNLALSPLRTQSTDQRYFNNASYLTFIY